MLKRLLIVAYVYVPLLNSVLMNSTGSYCHNFNYITQCFSLIMSTSMILDAVFVSLSSIREQYSCYGFAQTNLKEWVRTNFHFLDYALRFLQSSFRKQHLQDFKEFFRLLFIYILVFKFSCKFSIIYNNSCC